MSDCRHRGFSVLCSFSDVKGNITWHYVPFALLPAFPTFCPSFRPSFRLPCSAFRPHIPISRTYVLYILPCLPSMRRNFSDVFPFAAIPAHATKQGQCDVLFNKRACIRTRMRLIGRSTHFQNLSTRKLAQSFLRIFCDICTFFVSG